MLDESLFDNRYQLKNDAQSERAKGDAEETLAPAQDRDNGINEAERIESGGDTKPEKTGFAHDLVPLQYSPENDREDVWTF